MHARSTIATLLCALAAHGGAAAAPADGRLGAELKKLLERVERLERDNRDLRERLDRSRVESPAAARALPQPAPATVAPAVASVGAPTLEQRVQTLEREREASERALATERLSEREPELVTRLKAVESQTLEMQKQTRAIEALEGITTSVSLTAMTQSVNAAGAADARRTTRANYRGDVTVTLPGGSAGDIEGKIFAHLRLGQGQGLALLPTYTSTPNTIAFEPAAGADEAYAILAQAWYQLDIPLPRGGYKPHSKQHLELTLGKIDPFLFFDQNAIADDETARFTNNAFVHNPLLDSGGDTGADAYGFAPGARLAYVSEGEGGSGWAASLGVFGAGAGANFSGSLAKPFVIGQLETTQRLFGGLAGTYRVYAWRNGQATDADETTARHTGWGLSIDQRVSDDWTLFGRWGQQIDGKPRFKRALTVGAETSGNLWGRGADGVGLAVGVLRTDPSYRASAAANGDERNVELYYRYALNSAVQITPDLQWIQRPGGRLGVPAVRTLGLRARVEF